VQGLADEQVARLWASRVLQKDRAGSAKSKSSRLAFVVIFLNTFCMADKKYLRHGATLRQTKILLYSLSLKTSIIISATNLRGYALSKEKLNCVKSNGAKNFFKN